MKSGFYYINPERKNPIKIFKILVKYNFTKTPSPKQDFIGLSPWIVLCRVSGLPDKGFRIAKDKGNRIACAEDKGFRIANKSLGKR